MSHSSEQPRPRDDEFETIVPASVELGGPAPQGEGPGSRGSLWVWVGLAGTLVLGALVVLVLPGQVDAPRSTPTAQGTERRADAETVAPAAPDAEPADPDSAPWRQLQLERARRAAQDVLAEFVELQEELEARAVERWAPEAMQAAEASAEAGDVLFLDTDYPAAQARYEEAVAAARALSEQADSVLEQALLEGEAALEVGDAQAAETAFGLAVAAGPADDRAREGLRRAEVLSEVLGLLEEAEQAFAASDLVAARERAQAAAKLSPGSPRPTAVLRRIASAERTRRYNQLLSEGYSAIGAGRWQQARERFEAALELVPDAAEARDGLRIVEQESTAARIAEMAAQAESMAADEDWSGAAASYRELLELDPTLALAQRGLARARTHADVHAELQALIEDPLALNDEVLLAEAETAMSRAADLAATDPTPTLLASLTQVREILRAAVIPVPVTFVSDGRTRVIVKRIGTLGTFTSTTLSLRPGRYEAQGSRDGFRDVLVPVAIRADGDTPPVRIVCSERI